MTPPSSVVWRVTALDELAAARTALARALVAAGTSTMDRLRLVSGMTSELRTRVDQAAAASETTLVTLEAVGSGSGAPADTLRLTLRRTLRPGAARPAQEPFWERTVVCGSPVTGLQQAASTESKQDLGGALLSADRDLAELVEHLDQQAELIRSHREELHHTNQGVLALHAELDTAAKEQRRLLSAERSAHRQAEEARRRLLFLTDASAALAASLSHDAIIDSLHELLVPAYARAIEVRLMDGKATPRRAGSGAGARAGAGAGAVGTDPALLRLPLTSGQTALGVLSLVPADDALDSDDITMLRELAHRAAVALDNALRYEHHRDTAETLQRALLPDLPEAEGTRLAARYVAATRGLNVGGDWYDAFTQPDGSITVVVGDVTGHGLRAAVMMGQLRTALRAHAIAGESPGVLLSRLHAFIHYLDQELYATAAVARLQPGEPVITWASAGHPPPLLRTPHEGVRVLEEKSGPMLGLPLQSAFLEHTAPFPADSTLLLYTDGLVERRADGIDPGIGRLVRAFGALNGPELSGDLDRAATVLLGAMLADSDGEDDTCLLLCHTPPLLAGDPLLGGHGHAGRPDPEGSRVNAQRTVHRESRAGGPNREQALGRC